MQATEVHVFESDAQWPKCNLATDNSKGSKSPRIKPERLKKSNVPKPRFHITNFSNKLTPSLIQKVQNLHRSLEVKKPTIVIRHISKQPTPGYQGGLFEPHPTEQTPQAFGLANSHRKHRSEINILESLEVNERDTSDFKLKTIRDEVAKQMPAKKHNRLETEFSKTCDDLHSLNKKTGKDFVSGIPHKSHNVEKSNYPSQRTSRMPGGESRERATYTSRLAPHQTQMMANSKLSKPLWGSATTNTGINPNKDKALHLTVGPSNTYEFEINETRLRNRFLEYRKENRDLIQSVRHELQSKQMNSTATKRGDSNEKSTNRTLHTQEHSKTNPSGQFDWSSAKKYPEKQSDIILVTYSVSPSKSSKNVTGGKDITEPAGAIGKGSQIKKKLPTSSNSLVDVQATPETTTVEGEPVLPSKFTVKPVPGIPRENTPPSKQRLLLYSLKYEALDALANQESAKKKGALGNFLQAGLSTLLSGLAETTTNHRTEQDAEVSRKIQLLIDLVKDKDYEFYTSCLQKHKPYYLVGLQTSQVSLDKKMRQQESRAAFTRKLSQESRGEILKRMLGVSQHYSEHTTSGGFAGSLGPTDSPKHIRQDILYAQYKLLVHEEAFQQLMDVLQQQQAWSPVNSEELKRKKVVLRHWEFMISHSKYQLEFNTCEDYRHRPLLFLDLDETLVSTLTSKKRKPGFSLLQDPTVDTVYVGTCLSRFKCT